MTTKQKVKAVMHVWREFKNTHELNMMTLAEWPKFLRERLPWA